jgi:transposase-like protein
VLAGSTRKAVEELLAQGLTQTAIAKRLGKSKSTIAYHARTLGRPVDERCNRRYDWAEVQRFYDEGHSISECQARFGFARETWNSARRRGDVVSRPQAMPLEELLQRGPQRSRFNIKLRLLSEGLKENRCERCGLDSWMGGPLAMCLHHVNGDNSDNTLRNLTFLCPNCHSQTENFAGRAKRRTRFGARHDQQELLT